MKRFGRHISQTFRAGGTLLRRGWNLLLRGRNRFRWGWASLKRGLARLAARSSHGLFYLFYLLRAGLKAGLRLLGAGSFAALRLLLALLRSLGWPFRVTGSLLQRRLAAPLRRRLVALQRRLAAPLRRRLVRPLHRFLRRWVPGYGWASDLFYRVWWRLWG